MPGSAVTTPPPLQSIPANEWQATVVVGAESVSGPSGSWPSNSGSSTLCAAARTLCPKSFAVGEQGSAFTGNDQLEGDIDRKRQLLAKPIRPLCHRVEMSARLAPTPEISFFLFSKLRRIWQHSNPTYRLMFPGLSLLNGILGCKGAFQLGEQVTDGLLRPGLRADNFPTLEIFLTKHQL